MIFLINLIFSKNFTLEIYLNECPVIQTVGKNAKEKWNSRVFSTSKFDLQSFKLQNTKAKTTTMHSGHMPKRKRKYIQNIRVSLCGIFLFKVQNQNQPRYIEFLTNLSHSFLENLKKQPQIRGLSNPKNVEPKLVIVLGQIPTHIRI